MSDHPDFLAIKARHKAEIDGLTTAFGEQYARLMNAQGAERDVKAIHALRTKHRADIKELVFRHIKIENEWRPAPAAPAAEPKVD